MTSGGYRRRKARYYQKQRLKDRSENMARKPVPRTGTYLKFGCVITEHQYMDCPQCGQALNAGPNYQPRYCDQCGQIVDFSGVEWKEDRELGFVERREVP